MENRFGTTSDMIIREVANNGMVQLIAIDDKGLYLTTRDRVDRPVADVNRYGSPREAVNRQLTALGIDPDEMFSANRHRIRTDAGAGKGKALNPIKASKRRF